MFSQQHTSWTNWYEQKYPRPVADENKDHPFGRKASDVTQTRQRLEASYTKRSNICTRCFTTKSTLTGECLCTS